MKQKAGLGARLVLLLCHAEVLTRGRPLQLFVAHAVVCAHFERTMRKRAKRALVQAEGCCPHGCSEDDLCRLD